MLCLASFIVLAILGIFSLHFRELAKEAFVCVFRRVTLRPCETNFGEKVKAQLTSWLMVRWPLGAKLIHKYAEVFAWIFVILSLITTLYTTRGLYYYFHYGSCTPQNPNSCIINRITGQPQVDCTISPIKSHNQFP